MFTNKKWSPVYSLKAIARHRNLVIQLSKREIVGRYKGSYLGLIWSFVTPIIMLIIYTFFFSVIFEAKWDQSSNNKLEFAMVLFCGLTAFTIFSEVISRAPTIISGNVNYVKKVVFPLEILPVTLLISSLVNFSINLGVLIVFLLVFYGGINWTVIFVPVVIFPLVLITLGLAWLVASLGVYFRDIGQIIGVVLSATMFLSPIFYSMSMLPEEYRFILHFNPLSYVIEDLRYVVIWGQLPNWNWLILGTLIGIIMYTFGHAWFQRTKGGFSDVL